MGFTYKRRGIKVRFWGSIISPSYTRWRSATWKNLELRFGYNRWQHDQAKVNENFDLAGASIGVGINLKKLEIDISRNSLSDIGGIVQISVRTKTH